VIRTRVKIGNINNPITLEPNVPIENINVFFNKVKYLLMTISFTL